MLPNFVRRIIRKKIENQILLENLNIFKSEEEMLLTRKEFADLLAVQETEHELQELFQMYSISVNK